MPKSLALARYIWPHAGCVTGPKVEAYERAFASAIGARGAVGFWKGRVAFYAALKVLGLGEGDEIIMPAYTCLVVPAAASYLGVVPVYADIEPTWCTLDPDKVARALTPRTKAIMVQHTYGWPSAGLDDVLDFARRKGLPVIEDCCHALGTRWHGRHVGTLGVAGFFSHQWSKPFTTGLGGMLVCNDADFERRVFDLREDQACTASRLTAAQLAVQSIVFDTAVYPKTMAMARRAYRWLSTRSIITGSTAKGEYTGDRRNYFRGMCEVQAAAGLYELSRLDEGIAHRRRLTDWYVEALREAGWPVPPWPVDAEVTLLRFPVRVANKVEALAAAEKEMVEVGDWFVQPLHSYLARQEDFGYQTGMCPEADRAAREIINLPVHGRVNLKHAQRVMDFLAMRERS